MTEFTNFSDIEVDGKVKSSSQGDLIGSLTVLPTASVDYENLIILYRGPDTDRLKNNKFYQCQYDGKAYDWVEIKIGGGIESVAFKDLEGNATDNASLKTELDKHTEKEIIGPNGKALIFNEADGGGAKMEFNDGLEVYVGVNDNYDDETQPVAQMYADRKNASTGQYEGTIFNLYQQRAMYVNKEERAKGEYKKEPSRYEPAIKKDINPAVKDITISQYLKDVEYDYLKNGDKPVMVDGAKRAISDELPAEDGTPGKPFSEKYAPIETTATKEELNKHVEDKNNPHTVNKTQVGLSNVDNTSDLTKPISNPQQSALNMKQAIANMVNSLDGDLTDKYPSAICVKNALVPKEDKSNKKTEISDATDTDDYYASVHAIRQFVNSSIQTATANSLGSWATWDDVPEEASGFRLPPTKNDYIVVLSDTSHGHDGATWRYKYLLDPAKNEYSKDDWVPEYKVNDKPFTQAQWNAIDSGITSALVAEISALRTEVNNIKTKMLTARSISSREV